MKRCNAMLLAVSVMLLGALLSSCDKTVGEYSPSKVLTWKESMHYAMNVAENHRLSLESYKYLGAVESEDDKVALISEIFSDDAYFVTTTDNHPVRFMMWTYGEYIEGMRKELASSNKANNIFTSRQIKINKLITERKVGVVELNWCYLGHKITTKAIVALDGDEEFLYDNIMSYAPTDNDLSFKEEESEKRLSSGNKKSHTYVYNAYGCVGFDGVYDWECKFKVETVFNLYGLLVDKKLYKECRASAGWDIFAEAVSVSSELFEDDHHEYECVFVYGNTITDVKISTSDDGRSNVSYKNGGHSKCKRRYLTSRGYE